jgi:hypothetical protein
VVGANGPTLMTGMIDAILSNALTCGNAQSGNLTRCASDPEQVEVDGHSRSRLLAARTKTRLGRGHDDAASIIYLSAVHTHTADIVDLGLGMAACVVLNAADRACAADYYEMTFVAENLTAA